MIKDELEALRKISHYARFLTRKLDKSESQKMVKISAVNLQRLKASVARLDQLQCDATKGKHKKNHNFFVALKRQSDKR